MKTKRELSILIPNYNNVCVGLVSVLQQQAAALDITYEILVADDASPDQDAIRINRAINELPHCRYIVKEQNSGSAATRNYLGARSRYHWLLFMDCDIDIPDDRFLERYVKDEHEGVVNGGICIADDDRLRHNLRYLYEKDAEPEHSAEKRQADKYHEFRSTNFMIEREVFEACPFDERFKRSGYEDVLFGKTLKQQGVSITHIDNPDALHVQERTARLLPHTDLRHRHPHRGGQRDDQAVAPPVRSTRAAEPLQRATLSEGVQHLPYGILPDGSLQTFTEDLTHYNTPFLVVSEKITIFALTFE